PASGVQGRGTRTTRGRAGRGSRASLRSSSGHLTDSTAWSAWQPSKLGGGLRPPSESSPQDAVRAAGRRGRRASRSTAGGWAPRVRGERPDHAPPSEASIWKLAAAKPALEPQSSPAFLRCYRFAAV